MDKLSNTGKWAIIAAVAVIAIAVVAVYGGRQNPANLPNPPAGVSGQSGGGTVPSAGQAAPPKSTGGATVVSPIRFIAPVTGVTWTIATPNMISWNKETGVTGAIELLDASTKKLTGIILTSIGPHQTSYEWNTRDLYVSRTNPAKLTVLPGRYVVRLIFDAPAYPPITSQPITIAAAAY